MTAALGDTVAVILIVFALAMAAIVVWRTNATNGCLDER
jgi:hypothetical protein